MDPSGKLKPTSDNPYVGPRPYTREEEKLFFGRERESRDLLSLVVSERLVLFYAQSGAGKTSLINTRLVPGLEGRNFEVLPVGRVSGELPPGLQVENIFANNLMLKLDMGEDDPSLFKGLRLADFLLNLVFDGKGFYYRPTSKPEEPENADAEAAPSEDDIQVMPRALIIDQFEELFTTHPEAWKLRREFIQQLAEAMEADPYLWVVLSMREDHIATLDPYLSLFPDGLSARYYMQRMGETAAFEAVTRPVEKLRPFEHQAAQLLVKNLSRISAGKDEAGNTRFVEGEFIEPVQLQVVCYQLWEDLKNQPGDQITLEDLQRLARGQNLAEFINRALGDFYQDTIRKALRQPGSRVSEGKLREWFSTELITEAGTRGFVYMGEYQTAGIPNPVVANLEGKLLRGESRAGGRWYELVHDRFIDPILLSNHQWGQTQQRNLLVRGVGGVFAFLLVLYILLAFNQRNTAVAQNYTATQDAIVGQTTVAAAEKNAGTAEIERRTAEAQATSANARLDIVQNSKNNLYATQVMAAKAQTALAVESTQAALSVEATRLALEMQFLTLQLTSGVLVTASATPAATPTIIESGDTPEPTSLETVPADTPTAAGYYSQQAATADALQIQLRNLQATQTAQAQPVRDQVIGYTINKTPIKVTQIGTGLRNIVLLGGLTGDFALSSSELAKTVLDYFKINMHQIPEDVTLHIIVDANPDNKSTPGTKLGLDNANGVALIRNWDCGWEKESTFSTFSVSGGSQPFSELETQVLRDYFLLTQPMAVVIWDATTLDNGILYPGACGDTSLFSNWLVSIYSENTQYRTSIATKDAGDAANWLDAQGIPAIRVKIPYVRAENLPRGELKQQESLNIQAIRAIIDYLAKAKSGS